jgi:KDO2-lipid IV(A) lauroyltransferase
MTGIRHKVEFLAFQMVKLFFFLLPRKPGLFTGKLLGLAFYALDKRHRLIALSNLKIAFGSELPPSVLKDIASKSFIHFGKFLADLIKFSRLKEEQKNKLITVEGEENLYGSLRKLGNCLPFSVKKGKILCHCQAFR